MLNSRIRRARAARRSIICSFALLAIVAGGRVSADVLQGAILTTVPDPSVAGVYSVVPMLPTGSGRFSALGYALDDTAGYLLASRFYEDGTLNTSYGEDGVSRQMFPSAIASAAAIPFAARTLPNGDFVMGTAQRDGATMRYGLARSTSPRAPATDLNVEEFAKLSFGTTDEAVTDFTVQADGRFVVVGHAARGADADVAVARYLQNGAIDTTFGNGGVTLVRLSGGDDGAEAVAVQTDGRIVVAGFTTGAATGTDSFAMRLNADGSIDSEFAVNGVYKDALPGRDAARSLALQPDGKILIGGFATDVPTGDEEMLVYRLATDGTLDASFANRGRSIATTPTSKTSAEQLLVFADGTFVAAGAYTKSNGGRGFMNLRFVGNDRDRDGYADAWGLLPDHVDLAIREGATPNAAQYADEVVVAGLDDNAAVPVQVYDGEYALNGAADYRTTMSWVRNGDRIRMRHTAARDLEQTSVSMLSIGGWVTENDLSWFEGKARSLFFTSKTAKSGPTAPDQTSELAPEPMASPSSKSGGGGASGVELLLAAAMAVGGTRKRRSAPSVTKSKRHD